MTSVPVSLIAGYLGAGKTTLVNHLLRTAGKRRVAVLVNDFGDINIDADLIEAIDEDIVRLVGGCACCRIGNDLASSLSAVIATDRYDYVLIEASGVSQPSRIAQTLPFVSGALPTATIVVCDATTIKARLSDQFVGDLIRSQILDAHLLVLNKSDCLSASDLSDCECVMTSVNANANLVRACFGNIHWHNIRVARSAPHQIAIAAKDLFKSTTIKSATPIASHTLLNQIRSTNPVRVKGFIQDSSGRQYVEFTGENWVWPLKNTLVHEYELLCIEQTHLEI